MTTQKLISKIANSRFKVMVGGETERSTNVLGLFQLLADFSDFFRWTPNEQKAYLKESIENKEFYIDADITCIPNFIS